MVLTSENNAREFDKLAQALMEQHPKIQTSEKPKHHVPPRSYHPKGGKSKGKGWSRFGNLGYDEDGAEED